jgi:large subunit ribosomal protein L13
MKTFSLKPEDIERKWYLVDAQGKVLGRLASEVAAILRGKKKPTFSPHMDNGDHVVVINADKVMITGKKGDEKVYFHFSGYPGGLRARTMAHYQTKKPEQIIRMAVKGMLPHNRLGRQMLKKLRVYVGGDHPHQSQSPQPIDVAS